MVKKAKNILEVNKANKKNKILNKNFCFQGTIFGVLLALIIGFIVVGILSGYTYSKYKGKTGAAYEAKLKFVNPSYEKSSISDS